MGSGKEATVRLTAELCDGWLPMHFVPGRMAEYRPWLEQGFARARAAGRDKGFHNFEIQAQIGVRITDDVAGALAAQKPGIALYVGGMGAREVNFHNEHMRRMGYAEAAERIQELFLAGRKDEAIATVPDEYVDERCLVGPEARIRERYGAWAESGITSLGLTTRQPRALEVLAECAREHPARGVPADAAR
jgi:alkanesulfonate monooxygenase SsuD/methylene tetrahydromethanopterin reductase-like flavin-dependent oxidoreductase (luciferase family)